MPFVTFPRCFDGYPLSALPDSLVNRLQKAPHWRTHVRASAVRLQAFCELTGQSMVGLTKRPTINLLEDFAAASFSNMFRDPARRGGAWMTLGYFRSALPDSLRFEFPTVPNQGSWPEQFRSRVYEFDRMTFDPVLSEFWRGWATTNLAGQQRVLNLHRFWNRFGPERSRELFSAADAFFSRNRYQHIPYLEAFSDHLVTRHEEIAFDDSSSVGQEILLFMQKHLRNLHTNGLRVSVILTDWKVFARLLSDHLLGKAWATPVPAIPLPRIPRVVGVNTNVRKLPRGNVVKTTLVTVVPLHVSDTEATQILFHDIQREADAILAWARFEVAEARLRVERRKELAKVGIPSVVGDTSKNTGLNFRRSRDCPDHLAHAAATFEKFGFDHLEGTHASMRLYPTPSHEVAWELAIPSANLLTAHAAILVHHHPKITPAFLSDLELYDNHDVVVGLIPTDAGWYLKSQKRRRGPRLAEQEVLLNEETYQIVRDVIELTTPLRKWLRERNDPQWRLLFLAAASLGTPPKKWGNDLKIYRRAEWLAERLTAFASQSDPETHDFSWLTKAKDAYDLASRFSLKRQRAQEGVIIYLKTGSVEQMAKALGHHVWSPKLLDHYLPRAIQEFFVERWVRLFQTGIICEAMSGSVHLLEASSFTSMDELDAFLEQHALRRIPAHLENPDQIGGRRTSQSDNRIVFGIEVGILTVLMSLEAAVRTAKRDPCGRAIRWARISERLIPHLETQTEQPEFRTMVAEARRYANPRHVESLIYD